MLMPDGLRRRRQERKWTQKQLAAYLEVQTNTVTRWEMGLVPVPRWVEIVFDRDFGKSHFIQQNNRLMAEVADLKRALAATRKGKGDPREVRKLKATIAQLEAQHAKPPPVVANPKNTAEMKHLHHKINELHKAVKTRDETIHQLEEALKTARAAPRLRQLRLD